MVKIKKEKSIWTDPFKYCILFTKIKLTTREVRVKCIHVYLQLKKKYIFLAKRKKGSIFLAFSVRLVICPDSSSRSSHFRFSNLRVSCLIDVCDLPQSLQVNAGLRIEATGESFVVQNAPQWINHSYFPIRST